MDFDSHERIFIGAERGRTGPTMDFDSHEWKSTA